jgi:hypothetical protein
MFQLVVRGQIPIPFLIYTNPKTLVSFIEFIKKKLPNIEIYYTAKYKTSNCILIFFFDVIFASMYR